MIKAVVCASKKNQKSADADFIVNWYGWSEDDQTISIMQKIEKNSEYYKSIYLDLVHQIGHQTNLKTNKSLCDEMSVFIDFSFWWMSLTQEKSPFRNETVLNSIKLIALTDILQELKINCLEIFADQSNILSSIKEVGLSLNIKEIRIHKTLQVSWSSFFLVHQLRGFVFLIRHAISRLAFKSLNKPKWKSESKKNIFLFSNFYNLDEAELKEKRIKYKQWENLPQFLNEEDIDVQFLNHFIYSPQISKESVAIKILKSSQDQINSHVIIDSYLDWKMLFRILVTWVKLNFKYLIVSYDKDLFTVKNKCCNLQRLHRSDLLSSWVGSTAVSNIIWYFLYEKITLSIPKDSLGLYLAENQGWERALVYHYKKNVGSKIIGVPHSSVRFWDLRYFQSVHENSLNSRFRLPQPDCFALNGEQAYEEFYKNKTLNIKKVEALRYQYLSEINPESMVSNHLNTLLVLGDFSLERTLKMLSIASEAMLKSGGHLVYKPHPFCPDISQFFQSTVSFEVNLDPFDKLSKKYSVTFVSNTSSVAIDAYLSGLQVFVFLDDDDFNMSPLKNWPDVSFITKNDLNYNFFTKNEERAGKRENRFFYLDKKMNLWKKLFNEYGFELRNNKGL